VVLDEQARPAPDLIGRDFTAARPGTRLVADITCLPTEQGRLYLPCWLDLATSIETFYNSRRPRKHPTGAT
jgi:hypothetical protein